MKKKGIKIAVIVAVLVVLAGVAALIWLHYLQNRPGAHLVGEQLYVDVSGTGFEVDKVTGKPIEKQTPVTVIGNTNKDDVFEGELMVLGYPITETGKITGDAVMEDLGDGFYSIYYAPACTHTETVNGVEVPKRHMCAYEYVYYFYPEDPDFLIVSVYEWQEYGGDYHYIVVADSEEQAREDYLWFLANEP